MLMSSTARVLSLPPSLLPSLPLSLPPSSRLSPSPLRPELMAASAAKSSQCDKVMWSQRGSGKVSCISGSIYTDYAVMRKGPKNKNKWRKWDDIAAPRLLTAVFALISRWLWGRDDGGSQDLLLASPLTFLMSCSGMRIVIGFASTHVTDNCATIVMETLATAAAAQQTC